jgi:hypothetical protein
MHPRQAALLSQAENLTQKLAGKEAATPVLWKYVDPDSNQEFFLTVRLPTVHSPFSGKSAPQHPERYQIPEVQKELRQVEGPAMPVLAAAQALVSKLASAPVLWKYVDEDSGKEFFLPTRMQNVHSPYSGKSVPQRPEKFQMSEVQKELKQVEKSPGAAPGPKQSAPKAKPKKKHASDDPAWKA